MKRRIGLVFFSIVVASLAAGAQGPATPSGEQNPAVIDVNGAKVYAAEISMIMQNIAVQMGGRDKVENEEALMQMATQRIIEQKLLAQEARRTSVQPNELRLAEMIQAVERQAGGREALESNIGAFGMSYDQLVGFLREMELSRVLIQQQISPTIQVSDEEIEAFYNENPEIFNVEARVRARHIIFRVSLQDDAETIAAARAKAEDARRRAIAGEDFVELARELSEEKETAANGGDLGFFTYGQTAPTFAAAAFALEPGGISSVVRTDFGMHVIKVEEKQPARLVPLDEASDQIRKILIQKETGQKVAKLVESLASEGTITNLVDGSAMNAAPQ
jgi:parvulin-like peptidyl-prolyl isomerase